MSRRNALGDINLDFEESINTINGIPITPSNAVEEKEEKVSKVIPKKEEKKGEKEDLRSAFIKDKKPKIDEKYEAIERIKEEFKDLAERKDVESITSSFIAKDNKPSTKKHLKEGYTRHTFAIKDEQLELIRALAEYKGIEQKQLLEKLLDKAFESIDENTKKKALKNLQNDNNDIDIFS